MGETESFRCLRKGGVVVVSYFSQPVEEIDTEQ